MSARSSRRDSASVLRGAHCRRGGNAPYWRSFLLAGALAAGFPTGAGAQSVVPADEARARVVVREEASRQSRDLGALHQGGAEYLGSIQGLQWHHVRLPDGTLGFVRSARTRIVPGVPTSALPPDESDAPDGEGAPEAPGDALGAASESASQPPAVAAAPPGGALGFHRGLEPEFPESVRPSSRHSELALVPESSVGRLAPERESPGGIEVVPEPEEDLALDTDPAPRRSAFQAFRDALASLFGLKTRVDFEIRSPSPGQTVHQHREPNLPVSGFARAVGAGGDFDVVIAIDVSTSTTEASGADVNGDGKTEDAWRGSDSILAAQIVAAQNFVRTLSRLPGNADGRRIRVGVVTFSGDERFHRRREDKHFRPTREKVYELARRDAEVWLPLGDDYDFALRRLDALALVKPSGTTDFAAGIGRAIIELTGMASEGGLSQPRLGAQRVILFMTDGKPRIPYDRFKARKAALFAAKMAAERGIRINAFALGRNAVTRRVDGTVRDVARRTNGAFVELQNPGDIVSILGATPFAYVDRVKLINRTTKRETRYIATGIDGSFYGEVPLTEGQNEIEVVAVLHDDREASERFQISYRYGAPREEQLEALSKIRGENQAIIDRIKDDLARKMQRARAERVAGTRSGGRVVEMDPLELQAE